jgi:membrane protease YdiL (CAAX protease family)
LIKNKISLLKASSIFIGFTVYFFILLYTLLPFLKANFALNSALYWFITGYFLFIPIFIFSIIATKLEGNKSLKQVIHALNLKTFTNRDWKYAIIGLLLVFVFTGLIFGASFLLNKYFGVKLLTTTPWFMEMHPFRGYEKLLLVIWLPMFVFNILGEEILWRGYIQSRLQGRFSWLLCSLLWLLFHLPFGMDLMLMLIPVIIIIPYIFSKTQNTWIGVFIHGLYNGPIFVAVALGLIN